MPIIINKMYLSDMIHIAFDFRKVLRYSIHMIKNWKHKGLRLFFENGVTSGIQVKHKNKLKIILQLLDAASKPEDLDLPGMRFHSLKGNYKGYYSVTVNGNWRIIYGFEGADAILVDYLDYH